MSLKTGVWASRSWPCGTALPETAVTGSIEDDYEIDPRYDEPEHPIPALQVIDVWSAKNSGAVLLIIVASPLRADEHSQERLVRKIEG
jgi:hypothetical protein